jgi:hypothetical protein
MEFRVDEKKKKMERERKRKRKREGSSVGEGFILGRQFPQWAIWGRTEVEVNKRRKGRVESSQK